MQRTAILPGRDLAMIVHDDARTVLGLLDFSYTSQFYGYDILKLEPGRERILLGNYQKVGYLRGDVLTVLTPKQGVQQTLPRFDDSGDATALGTPRPELIDDAVSYYETASERFTRGQMRIGATLPAAKIAKN